MREEASGEARRHLAQLDSLRFAPSEKAPHGMGLGAPFFAIPHIPSHSPACMV